MQVVADQAVGVRARLVFASGEWTEATARVIERSASWRRRATMRSLAWWLLAPVVVWIPPHFPWLLIVLGLGAWGALNRMREFRTLVSLHGACPKCGTEQDFRELGRMREPHRVHCAQCRWELRADVARAG